MAGAIGWQNWIEEATVLTASGQVAGFEVENIIDWRTVNAWQGVTTTQTIIEATLDNDRTADAFGLFGHNMTEQVANIEVQWYDGANWQAFSNLIIGPVPGVLFRKYSPQTSNRWRLILTTVTFPALITHWILCDTLDTRGQKAPFSIAKWDDRSQYKTHITEGGQFVGRTFKSSSYRTSMNYDILPRSSVDSDYMPFVRHARQYPFYYSWDIDRYPDDAAYCWCLDGQGPRPRINRLPEYIALNANLEARLK